MPKRTPDILDLLEEGESGDDAKVIEELKSSRLESFDDHQQWMIESFDSL